MWFVRIASRNQLYSGSPTKKIPGRFVGLCVVPTFHDGFRFAFVAAAFEGQPFERLLRLIHRFADGLSYKGGLRDIEPFAGCLQSLFELLGYLQADELSVASTSHSTCTVPHKTPKLLMELQSCGTCTL